MNRPRILHERCCEGTAGLTHAGREGRMTPHSYVAAKAWLRVMPKSDQALLVSACEVADGKPAQIVVVWSEQNHTTACVNSHVQRRRSTMLTSTSKVESSLRQLSALVAILVLH